jgi:hypothetical protein
MIRTWGEEAFLRRSPDGAAPIWGPAGDHVENRSIFRQSLCVKELPVIYGEQAAAFMEFVSAEYEARDWTPG